MDAKMWPLLGFFAMFVVEEGAATSYLPLGRDICQPTSSQIKELFTEYTIVPQVIPEPPIALITMLYGDNRVCLGNRISPCETTIPPFWSWPNVNPSGLYTYVALDLDYPQFSSSRGPQVLIELVVNIPGANFAAGVSLTPLKALEPLPNTGDHRYVFLSYKQQRPIKITTDLFVRYSQNFQNFSIANFVDENNLGNPVAGNFFISKQTLCSYCKAE